MERKSMKYEEKKAERAKDRGDKTVLHSILDDLDTKYFVNRDRGDVKTNIRENHGLKNSMPGISGNNKRLLETEVLETIKVPHAEAQKTTPAHKTRKTLIPDSDDSFKRGYLGKKLKEESKKLEEARGNTVKGNHKAKTGNKAQNNPEQVTELQHVIERTDDARIVQETLRIVNEKLKRRNEDSKVNDELKKNDKVRNLPLPPAKELNVLEKALEQRKLLRDRYTLKLHPNRNVNKSKDNLKNEYFEIKDLKTFEREKLNESPKENVETTKLPKKHKESTDFQRKPIITTIKKNDHRIYKAVTFIDKKESTPLQIKIPNSKRSAETNTVKVKPTTTPSKSSVHNTKDNPNTKKSVKEKKSPKRSMKRRPSSPDFPMNHGNPQTEVAKWEPSSITQHTKPYYEAWVDTTLAAILKCTEFDHSKMNKQHFINSFKRALESRPSSPIFANINDEKYVGKITVNKSKKSCF